ncbi:MAG: succinyldiaminopimelate transaminase [Gammaproteobacteria bacterium]|nr:succinyldiaminopimelate transaminase [Gammaproteobacteria bacterium]MDE0273878.1 succinyldiaminopimelate transaminase [Gammaproteobacteria bacterium]
MNPRLGQLHDYPFQRLAALLDGVSPAAHWPHVSLSIGEPKHEPPAAVVEFLADRQRLAEGLGAYPATRGIPELRETVCAWLKRRFGAELDPERGVLPVSGTREALFSFAQAAVGAKPDPVVMLPNPFYQIYEGAAILSGAAPHYLNADAANGYQPDFESVPDALWARTEVIYLCSPGNPTGKVVPAATQRWLIEQAHRFDFVIAADECYSEIYLDESHPPTGLLRESDALGNPGYARCIVFHSLSKRSSLPGLRSGFVAGDAGLLARYYQHRTYQGAALPLHVQQASALAWRDEDHARRNRALYRAKFEAATPLLNTVFDVRQPEGGFYFWVPTEEDDRQFARALFRDLNISVLPGSFLGRETKAGNPGAHHVRIALVAPQAECVEALSRLTEWGAHQAGTKPILS